MYKKRCLLDITRELGDQDADDIAAEGCGSGILSSPYKKLRTPIFTTSASSLSNQGETAVLFQPPPSIPTCAVPPPSLSSSLLVFEAPPSSLQTSPSRTTTSSTTPTATAKTPTPALAMSTKRTWVNSTSGWSPPLVVTGQHRRLKRTLDALDDREDYNSDEREHKVKQPKQDDDSEVAVAAAAAAATTVTTATATAESASKTHRSVVNNRRKKHAVKKDTSEEKQEEENVLEGMAKRLKLSTSGTSPPSSSSMTLQRPQRPTFMIDQDLAPHHEEHEVAAQWNDWNYWKLPLPALIDLEEDRMHGE